MGYAVVIVHYKEPVQLREVVSAVGRQTLQPTSQFVVDNGRSLSLEARDELSRLGYVVIGADNLGYAAAVNAVRESLSPDVESLLVLTHDVQMDDNTVESMVAMMSKGDRIGVVGPVLNFVSKPEVVFSRGGQLKWGRRPVHVRTRAVGLAPQWVDGAVMLLNLQGLNEVGWLNEQYFLYFEEIDLCLSMQACGWSIRVAGDARARQEPGNYTPYLAIRNHLLLGRRHGHQVSIFVVVMARLIRACISVLLSGDIASITGSIQGTVDGLRGRGGPPSKPGSPTRKSRGRP